MRRKPTRVSFRYIQEGDSYRKVRVSKRSGLIIERPAILAKRPDYESACPHRRARLGHIAAQLKHASGVRFAKAGVVLQLDPRTHRQTWCLGVTSTA